MKYGLIISAIMLKADIVWGYVTTNRRQMCVALDSIRTVALDGKHSLEEISALFRFVEIAVVMDFVPVLTCVLVQVDKYHLLVDRNLLSVKMAARMEDGVLDLIAVRVSTDLLVLSVKELVCLRIRVLIKKGTEELSNRSSKTGQSTLMQSYKCPMEVKDHFRGLDATHILIQSMHLAFSAARAKQPQVPQQLLGWRLNHFPGQPVPMLDNPFSEVKFPNIQSKPPLVQLEAISSSPITCYLGEETDPHLSTTSFQAKQSQLPQPLLMSLVLQTLHQLRCPSLDMLQHLNVFLVVSGPKLNTVLEVQPHQCRVQGHNHFPSPAGCAIFDTSQDAIGFLGHLGTLLAHIQAAVNQHPQVLFHWAAFQPLFPKPVVLHGVVVAQGTFHLVPLRPVVSDPSIVKWAPGA
ncbi:hypothetical protein QYF61_015652 [Mycteria americana]|uniref:Uncharacterized protein n=1 Tax=Mycteria americana TaxID=33587 RepID=A0AAN7NSJ3_MYCAM|nr:hypothetical protein QYF61_015652 [Mycteria americana]